MNDWSEWSDTAVEVTGAVSPQADEIARLCGILREIVDVLGPDRICDCKAYDCGLRDEAQHALDLARDALRGPT